MLKAGEREKSDGNDTNVTNRTTCKSAIKLFHRPKIITGKTVEEEVKKKCLFVSAQALGVMRNDFEKQSRKSKAH